MPMAVDSSDLLEQSFLSKTETELNQLVNSRNSNYSETAQPINNNKNNNGNANLNESFGSSGRSSYEHILNEMLYAKETTKTKNSRQRKAFTPSPPLYIEEHLSHQNNQNQVQVFESQRNDKNEIQVFHHHHDRHRHENEEEEPVREVVARVGGGGTEHKQRCVYLWYSIVLF